MRPWLGRIGRRCSSVFTRAVASGATGGAVPAAARAARNVGQAVRRGTGALPRSALLTGGSILTGLVVIAALTVGGVAHSTDAGHSTVVPAEAAGSASSPAPSEPVSLTGAFDGIVLPDLLIVMPSGLTRPDVAGLRAITGVRKIITFDGAQITVAGRPASVIGVNPDRFRSWVPLPAASDQALWNRLAQGDFVATRQSARSLGLVTGRRYRLAAKSAVGVRFAGSAF